MHAPELSVVIPCYNESERIEPMLQQWISLLETTVASYEIITINDGSIDGTARVLDRLRRDHKSLRVVHQLNMGIAGAIRRGCEAARGHYVLLLPVDERFEPSDFARMWEARAESIEILAKRTHRIESILSRGWHESLVKLANWFFGVEIEDPVSWFRLLRRDVLHIYLSQIPRTIQSLPLALAYLVKKDHPSLVAEVPIHYGVAKRIKRYRGISRRVSAATTEIIDIFALRRFIKAAPPSLAPSVESLTS